MNPREHPTYSSRKNGAGPKQPDRHTPKPFASRLRRRAFTVSLICAGLLGLGFVTSIYAVSKGWQRDRLTQFISRKLSATLGVDLRIHAMEGPLWPWLRWHGVELRPLEVEGEAGQSEALLRIEAAELRIRPRALLHGELEVDALSLEGIALHIARDAKGQWNFSELTKEDSAQAGRHVGFPFSVALRHFSLREGAVTLVIDDPERPSRLHGSVGAELRDFRLSSDGRVRGPLDGSLELSLEPSVLLAHELRRGLARATWAEDGFRLERVFLEAPEGRLDFAGQAEILSWLQGSGNLRAELNGDVEALNLASLFSLEQLGEDWHGDLSIQIEIAQSTAEAPLSLKGGISLRNASSFDGLGASQEPFPELGEISARAAYEQGHWEVDDMVLAAAGMRATLNGTGDNNEIEALEGKLQVDDLSMLNALSSRLPPLRGIAQLAFRAHGPWSEPQLDGVLNVGQLSVNDVFIGSLNSTLRSEGSNALEIAALSIDGPKLSLASQAPARIAWKEGHVEVRNLALASQSQRLFVDGSLSAEGFDALRLETTRLELAPLAALAGIRERVGGRLDATLRATGSFINPVLQADAHLEKFRYASFDAEQVELTVRRDSGPLQAHLDVVQAKGHVLTLDAEFPTTPSDWTIKRLMSSETTRLDLLCDDLELSQFQPLVAGFLGEIEGRLDARLEVRGAQPLPVVRGELTLANGGLQLVDSDERYAPIQARLRADQGQLIVEELSVQDGEQTHQLSGEINFTKLSHDRYALRFEHLMLKTSALAITSVRPALVEVSKHGLDIDQLELAVGQGLLRARGHIDAKRVDNLSLEVIHLDLAPFMRELSLAEQAQLGVIDGTLTLDGPFPIPNLQGELQWTIPPQNGLDESQLRVAFLDDVGDRLLVNASLLYSHQELLTASAKLPRALPKGGLARLLEDPRTSFSLHGDDVDLAVLAPVAQRWVKKLEGHMRVQLDLLGGSPAPKLIGTGALDRVTFRVPLLDQPIEIPQAHFAVTQDRLEIEALQIGHAKSGAQLTGVITLDKGFPQAAELQLDLEKLPFSVSNRMRGKLDGALRLTGELVAPVVKGALTLRNTRLFIPDKSDRLMREIRVIGLEEERARIPGQRERASVFDSASIDLDVHVPANTWVHQGESAFEVQGDVRVEKTTLKPPRYLGELRLLRGRYRFQGRTLDLREGFTSFTGSSKLDPQVHAVAEYRVKKIVISATLSGWLSNLQMALDSNPPMSQEEILSYLLFGEPVQDLSNFDANRLAFTATNLAQGLGAPNMGTYMSDVLPVKIDEFNVALKEGSKVALELGTYITSSLFLRYQSGYGSDVPSRIFLRWMITPRIGLESSTASDDTSGADLILNFDY